MTATGAGANHNAMRQQTSLAWIICCRVSISELLYLLNILDWGPLARRVRFLRLLFMKQRFSVTLQTSFVIFDTNSLPHLLVLFSVFFSVFDPSENVGESQCGDSKLSALSGKLIGLVSDARCFARFPGSSPLCLLPVTDETSLKPSICAAVSPREFVFVGRSGDL